LSGLCRFTRTAQCGVAGSVLPSGSAVGRGRSAAGTGDLPRYRRTPSRRRSSRLRGGRPFPPRGPERPYRGHPCCTFLLRLRCRRAAVPADRPAITVALPSHSVGARAGPPARPQPLHRPRRHPLPGSGRCSATSTTGRSRRSGSKRDALMGRLIPPGGGAGLRLASGLPTEPTPRGRGPAPRQLSSWALPASGSVPSRCRAPAAARPSPRAEGRPADALAGSAGGRAAMASRAGRPARS
jgi:hypothetical protein